MTAPLFQAPDPNWRKKQADSCEAWAERYGLHQSKVQHICLRWIAAGRCRRYCSKPGRWFDHPSAWLDAKGQPAVLLLQPYGVEYRYLELSRALNAYPALYLRLERPRNGWHDPKASLVEIWRDIDAYKEARRG